MNVQTELLDRILPRIVDAPVFEDKSQTSGLALVIAERDLMNALDEDGQPAFSVTNPQLDVTLLVDGHEVASFPCLGYSNEPDEVRHFVVGEIQALGEDQLHTLDEALADLLEQKRTRAERPRA